MTPVKRFERHADTYEQCNIVQKKVASVLAAKIPRRFHRAVDLGCGGGTLYKALNRPFSSYLAVDASEAMLARHPDAPEVRKLLGDFDDPALFESLRSTQIDIILSASALQWAKDLDWTLERIASLDRPVGLAIFTAGTFAALHETAKTRSPIRTLEETETLLKKHFDVQIEVMRDRLNFPDVPAMLSYIKNSGVGGGRNQAGVKAVRDLLRHYPYNYLEFEVLLATTFK